MSKLQQLDVCLLSLRLKRETFPALSGAYTQHTRWYNMTMGLLQQEVTRLTEAGMGSVE